MTLLLGFAAVNTGNNLLYLLVSALLGFLTVSGFLGRGNLVGLRIELEWPQEIYAGVPSTATVRLENRKGWPAFLLRVAVANAEAWLVTVGPRQVATEAVRVVFAGRGPHPQPGVRVYSPFPVNFFVRYVTVSSEQTLTVFPAPRPCPPPGAAAAANQGERSSNGRGYEGDVSRIGDYHGEPLKLIHWKLSARLGELKVRELSGPTREPVLIDPSQLPGPGLEERLSCASYLVNRLHREGCPVGLRLGDTILPPEFGRAHRLRLLTVLGRHGFG